MPTEQVPDAGAVNPADPVFQTRADLEVWVKGMRYRAGKAMEQALPFDRQIIAAARDARIRRVTLAHLHLKD